jgi:hypothetical protein
MSRTPVSLRGSSLNIDPKMMNGLTPQVIAIKNAAQSCFAACEVVMLSPDCCYEEFLTHRRYLDRRDHQCDLRRVRLRVLRGCERSVLAKLGVRPSDGFPSACSCHTNGDECAPLECDFHLVLVGLRSIGFPAAS